MILKRVQKEKTVDCLFDSSNVIASSYNEETRDLTITFKRGDQYTYHNVEKRNYFKFEIAESQGTVFNSVIKAHKYTQGKCVNIEQLILELNQYNLDNTSVEYVNLLKKFINKADKDKEITIIDLDVIIDETTKIKTHILGKKQEIND